MQNEMYRRYETRIKADVECGRISDGLIAGLTDKIGKENTGE